LVAAIGSAALRTVVLDAVAGREATRPAVASAAMMPWKTVRPSARVSTLTLVMPLPLIL
jgi:hypothetical protein